MDNKDEIKRLEEEIRTTKYNKHTQYHIGQLKAKLARLKEQRGKLGKIGSGGRAYSIKKSGDATVLIVGFPSVGKSTLLNRITNAESKIGDYDFTTLDIIPGVMEHNSARIQVLDVPGIVEGASSGRGRGKKILSVVRNADLVLILIEKQEQLDVIKRELYEAGLRLDEKRPDVVITKTHSGGIRIGSTVKLTKIDSKMVGIVLNERGIHNAEILIREDISLDMLIDAVYKNRVYVPSIVAYNKIDLLPDEKRESLPKEFIRISSKEGTGIEDLKNRIWRKLGLIRICMKKIGKEPDMEEPLIMESGSTVEDVARKIHKEFQRKLEYAKIWGPSAKFPGQKVGVNKTLQDRDIVELHME